MRNFSVTVVALVFQSLFMCCVQAQVNDHTLRESNLVVHWESNLGGAPLANGETSLLIWPHGSQTKEVVRVLLGGRQIAEYRGTDVDDAALEASLVTGKRGDKAPRLGFEGAKKKAERLAGIYAKVKKKVDVRTDNSQMIYAFAVSKSGTVTAMDAESGAVLWQNQLPHLEFPMLGPGASDKYVVAVNGNEYFAYDIQTGNLIRKQTLEYVPTGVPNVVKGKAVIPSIDGRLVFYDIESPESEPQIIRIGKENRQGSLLSADRTFIAWPMSDKLIMASLDDRKPYLWTSVSGAADIPAMPIRWESGSADPNKIDQGFIFTSQDGMVVKVNTDRIAPVRWRTKLGISTIQTPVMGPNAMLVVSENGLLFAIRTDDGESIWRTPVQGIQSIATITSTHAYVVDSARNLVTIELKSGKITGKVYIGSKTVLSNSVIDRVYMVDLHGKITCLREPDAIEPTLVSNFVKVGNKSDAAETEGSSAPATPTPESSMPPADPFGDPTTATEEDMPAGAVENADPFAAPQF